MKTIPLTQGKVALVDDEDFEWLSKFKWFAWRPTQSRVYYARAHKPGSGECGLSLYMHRLILPEAPEVDHINSDGLDNRRENLRAVSRGQQMRNIRKRSDSKHEFKGIGKIGNKWEARIRVDGVRYYIGLFSSQKEAAIAYDTKAKELHGEFAKLNFPEPVDG
jgi:hypothetical protein